MVAIDDDDNDDDDGDDDQNDNDDDKWATNERSKANCRETEASRGRVEFV